MKDSILYFLTPIGRLAIYLLFILVAFTPIALLIQVPVVFDLLNLLQPVYQEIIQDLIFIAVLLTALTMIFRVLPQYNWQQLFFRPHIWQSGLLKGTLIGFGLMVFCGGILFLLGNVQFKFNGFVWSYLCAYLLLFLVVAVFEELLFRTLPLIVFAERYPLFLTLIINGLLFAAAHLSNPNFTALAFVNIALAGCLFSLFVLLKWNISWAIGIHLGWNFTQGSILGYKVSGLDTNGILTAKPLGNINLSGGSFGLEGSALCTIILLILIIALFIKYRVHPLAIVEENQVEEETNELS